MQFTFSPEDYTAIAGQVFKMLQAHVAAEAAKVAAPVAQPPVAPLGSPVYQSAPVTIQQTPAPVQYVTQHIMPPATVPTTSAVTYRAGDANGTRLDDIVGSGTPGTVTLASGRTLSVPQPSGEGWVSYVRRVASQLASRGGRDVSNQLGILFQGTDLYFKPFGGFKDDGSNWPIAADYFANREDYTDPAEKARKAAEEKAYNDSIGWDGVPGHANDPWVSGAGSQQAGEAVTISS